MRAPLRGAHTSARIADKLLAAHSKLLAQNQTRKQAPSAHRSRCSLIQCFWETPLTQKHTHADRRHLPVARVARSFSNLTRPPSFQSHRITHTQTDRRHLPIARSFSTFGRPHLCHTNRIRCTQNGVIYLSLALLAHSVHLPDTAYFGCAEPHKETGVICPSLALLAHSALLADPAQGATRWHGSHYLPDHPPKYQPNQPVNFLPSMSAPW